MLKARCSCHSGDEPAAGLDLRNPKSFAKVISPGKPDESVLMHRLMGKGGKPQMPMGFAPFDEKDLAKVRSWILAGAPTGGGSSTHWAYQPVIRPPIPMAASGKGVRTPIDAFILKRLEKEGLKPSSEATGETLIRRASLDITGLPPSPTEIDAFLADKRPDAYERLIDRLLASPHYGEHMAEKWMDLARYADSDGYEKDLNRTAWKYRDWVIDAFNRNQPYDKFVVDQIAGDLEPYPTIDQLVATGFNRNTMMNLEGGVDQAEAHFNVVLDRVATTATVFLGSTLGCARCHDHKYDPFSQKDFYRMVAFFDNAVIEPQGRKEVGEEKWFEPFVEVPSPAQSELRLTLMKRLSANKARLAATSKSLASEREAWTKEAQGVSSTTLEGELKVPAGLKTGLLRDGSFRIEGESPATATYEFKATLPKGQWTGLRLEALPDSSFADNGPGRSDHGNFVLSKFEIYVGGRPLPLNRARADFEQQGFPIAGVFDSDPNSGWAVAGQTGKPHDAIFAFPQTLHEAVSITVRLVMDSRYPQHTLGRFRLSLMAQIDPERFAIPQDVRALLATQPNSEAVAKFYETISPTLQTMRAAIEKNEAALAKLKSEIPTAMVLRDKPHTEQLRTYVRLRGDFLNKGDQVVAGTPTSLPPMPPSEPGNRLGLAKWIANPRNPLTARVEVNRLWEDAFGRGLVETSEDFGTQGSPPTHPELLDWLASELVAKKWDVKAIQRLIFTSATYRQASSLTPERRSKDPQNLLLARGPRYRLEAETIRDLALFAGGLLDPKIGGPSVYPSQPEGTWSTPYNSQSWMTSQGPERYRRALYTFWKRTSPYPAFLAFDAPSREQCTARRIRTNTPLQALAMLNDEAILDAARALAHRMLAEPGSQSQRIEFGFRCATGRTPSRPEAARLASLLAKLEHDYNVDPEKAKKLGGTPHQAAWIMAASVLLNLDETITKS